MPYALVGGVAVIHHGYVRSTRDLDLLMQREDVERLLPHLAEHGFERRQENRLRHVASHVDVDLCLLAIRARALRPIHSCENSAVARRHQDVADVVALLEHLDESAYLDLEASLPQRLRGEVLRLRRDALDELRFENR